MEEQHRLPHSVQNLQTECQKAIGAEYLTQIRLPAFTRRTLDSAKAKTAVILQQMFKVPKIRQYQSNKSTLQNPCKMKTQKPFSTKGNPSSEASVSDQSGKSGKLRDTLPSTEMVNVEKHSSQANLFD